MKTYPEITVVVTCFNYGHYLEGCLRSVLDQTYQNFEIIVIDDGSTDKTPAVMKKFSILPKFRYLRQENKGQAHAKNLGIHHARGLYVAFLDADDYWEKNKLEKQMPLFEPEPVGVVYSRVRYVDEIGKEVVFELKGKYLNPRRGRVTDFLFLDNFIPFSSSIVRRKCFDEFGIFDESLRMGIDWDLWLRISTGHKFDFVDEKLINYRIGHSGQMSRNDEERQRCSDRIMAKFLSKYQGVVSKDTITKAMAFTYCNRGEYYRKINRWSSTCYFIKALKMNFFDIAAHKGLIKNILYW